MCMHYVYNQSESVFILIFLVEFLLAWKVILQQIRIWNKIHFLTTTLEKETINMNWNFAFSQMENLLILKPGND